jgi:hypothetical protein
MVPKCATSVSRGRPWTIITPAYQQRTELFILNVLHSYYYFYLKSVGNLASTATNNHDVYHFYLHSTSTLLQPFFTMTPGSTSSSCSSLSSSCYFLISAAAAAVATSASYYSLALLYRYMTTPAMPIFCPQRQAPYPCEDTKYTNNVVANH